MEDDKYRHHDELHRYRLHRCWGDGATQFAWTFGSAVVLLMNATLEQIESERYGK